SSPVMPQPSTVRPSSMVMYQKGRFDKLRNSQENVATMSPVTASARPTRAKTLASATQINPVARPIGRAIGSQRAGRHRDMDPSRLEHPTTHNPKQSENTASSERKCEEKPSGSASVTPTLLAGGQLGLAPLGFLAVRSRSQSHHQTGE